MNMISKTAAVVLMCSVISACGNTNTSQAAIDTAAIDNTTSANVTADATASDNTLTTDTDRVAVIAPVVVKAEVAEDDDTGFAVVVVKGDRNSVDESVDEDVNTNTQDVAPSLDLNSVETIELDTNTTEKVEGTVTVGGVTAASTVPDVSTSVDSN